MGGLPFNVGPVSPRIFSKKKALIKKHRSPRFVYLYTVIFGKPENVTHRLKQKRFSLAQSRVPFLHACRKAGIPFYRETLRWWKFVVLTKSTKKKLRAPDFRPIIL